MMSCLWKTLDGRMATCRTGFRWEVGKWYKSDKESDLSDDGFCGSENIIYAMEHIAPVYLAKVEVRGKRYKTRGWSMHDGGPAYNKQMWPEMRIIKAWEWRKDDSIALAIFAAGLCQESLEQNKDEAWRSFFIDSLVRALKYAKVAAEAHPTSEREATTAAVNSAWLAAGKTDQGKKMYLRYIEVLQKCHSSILRRINEGKMVEVKGATR